MIITDTVGFIRDLPPDLVNAFRATLEELGDADLLLHVVDAADPRHEGQMQAVEQILGSLELTGKRRMVVFNKADKLAPGLAAAMVGARRDAVAVSAATREGLPELLVRCERLLWADGRVELGEVVLHQDALAEGPRPADPAELDGPGAGPGAGPFTGEAAAAPPAEAPAPRLLPAAVRRVS